MLSIIMALRNLMFDKGWILKQTQFELPIISVGNLSVGGTGKTPHTEYLVKLLKEQVSHMAVLSRGYGRSTKGFRYVETSSKARDVGDEPLQIKQKFPDVTVAVCEKRVVGITKLLQPEAKSLVPAAIVLDDAFQHRYVKPGLSILLTDYRRPYYADHVMPWGRLRERRSGAKRADIIIVTKCPAELSDAERRGIVDKLKPLAHQQVFFTTFAYDTPRMFRSQTEVALPSSLLVLTGIAKPAPLYDYLESKGCVLQKLAFPDHHSFTPTDVQRINKACEQLPEDAKILTTEKDAARLQHLEGLSPQVLKALVVQPIKISFLFNETERFNKILSDYVGTN